jgi:hypothetical protein
MSYLLYCIFRSPAHQKLGIPPGVGGQPVCVVAQNGLSAGLSQLAESDLVPDISAILAYEKVIEAFCCHSTVIPMRYGCQLEGASEAVCMLEKHRDEYAALLRELEGAGEMSIHVLLDSPATGRENAAWPAPPKPLPLPGTSGTAYLAAKRRRYLDLDRAALDQRRLAEELCNSLSGLFVRRKVEFPGLTRTRLLSLYFLVPQGSVESFRQAARHFPSRASAKLLLSGPWPPYNFVDSLCH